MTTPDNIKLFNECVGIVFAELYSSFPVRITFDAWKKFPQKGSPSLICLQESMVWLTDNGYIQHGDVGGNGTRFYKCVLTNQGLLALNATPESLQTKITLGAKIVESVQSGAKEATIEAVKSVLFHGFSMIKHSIL